MTITMWLAGIMSGSIVMGFVGVATNSKLMMICGALLFTFGIGLMVVLMTLIGSM